MSPGAAILLIRHGETAHNAGGILQGQMDTHETGRQQARDLAAHLEKAGVKFDAIFSSDLSRAYDTADIIAANLPCRRLVVQKDKRLRERDLGPWQGKPRPADRSVVDQDSAVETNDQLAARLLAFLDDLSVILQDKNARIAVVSHHAAMKRLLLALSEQGFIDNTDGRLQAVLKGQFAMPNCSISALQVRVGEKGLQGAIQSVGDVSYLDDGKVTAKEGDV